MAKKSLTEKNVAKKRKAIKTPSAKKLLKKEGGVMIARQLITASSGDIQTIYIGIDAHKSSWSFTFIVNDQILEKRTIRADPHLLARLLAKYQGSKLFSAYEASYCGFGLHFLLTDLGVNNIVVSPNLIPKVKGDLVKTDRRDSAKLAIYLAKGLLKPIYIPTKQLIEIREIIRLRSALIKKRTAAINQFKATLMKNSIHFEFEGYVPRALQEFLTNQVSEGPVKIVLLMHFQNMQLFSAQIKLLDNQAEQLAMTPDFQRIYTIIRSVPGMGGITGRAILFELGDFARFPNEKTIAAYCGLTPSEYSSGEKTSRGRISGQGQDMLRALLIQAAWQSVRTDHQIRDFFERITKNSGNKKKAIVATARKLLSILYSNIKQNKLFEERVA